MKKYIPTRKEFIGASSRVATSRAFNFNDTKVFDTFPVGTHKARPLHRSGLFCNDSFYVLGPKMSAAGTLLGILRLKHPQFTLEEYENNALSPKKLPCTVIRIHGALLADKFRFHRS